MNPRKTGLEAFPSHRRLETLIGEQIALRLGAQPDFLSSRIPGVVAIARLEPAQNQFVNWDRIAQTMERNHHLFARGGSGLQAGEEARS